MSSRSFRIVLVLGGGGVMLDNSTVGALRYAATGVEAGRLHSIGSVDLARSRKRIHGFAGPAPVDAAPRGDQKEVDEAKFVAIDRARFLLHPAQVTFLDRLLSTLDMEDAAPSPGPPVPSSD